MIFPALSLTHRPHGPDRNFTRAGVFRAKSCFLSKTPFRPFSRFSCVFWAKTLAKESYYFRATRVFGHFHTFSSRRHHWVVKIVKNAQKRPFFALFRALFGQNGQIRVAGYIRLCCKHYIKFLALILALNPEKTPFFWKTRGGATEFLPLV